MLVCFPQPQAVVRVCKYFPTVVDSTVMDNHLNVDDPIQRLRGFITPELNLRDLHTGQKPIVAISLRMRVTE